MSSAREHLVHFLLHSLAADLSAHAPQKVERIINLIDESSPAYPEAFRVLASVYFKLHQVDKFRSVVEESLAKGSAGTDLHFHAQLSHVILLAMERKMQSALEAIKPLIHEKREDPYEEMSLRHSYAFLLQVSGDYKSSAVQHNRSLAYFESYNNL